MNLIVVSDSRRICNIRIRATFFSLVVVIGVAVSASLFLLGGRYASLQAVDRIADSYVQAEASWNQELLSQYQLITSARNDAQKRLDSMAARLSTLQGHIMRLDALGSRLVRMANLGDIDFSVNENPGLGGPKPSEVQQSLTVPDFLKSMDRLSQEIEDRNDKLNAIESMLLNFNLRLETVPTGSPVEVGWISSPFGWRTDPITGKREKHEGIDFAAKTGTEIRSVGAGIVTWSGRQNGYGHMIEIDHGNGLLTRYAHNKKNLVAVGERVRKGSLVALMGSTGRSTGSHLHFEVLKNGKFIDPREFIAENQ